MLAMANDAKNYASTIYQAYQSGQSISKSGIEFRIQN